MGNRTLIDFHTHTKHSPDSEASMSNMCEAACAAGLSCMAITDHVEIPDFLADGFDRSLAASFREACEMQFKFSERLNIACGMELGEPMHDVETAQALLDTYAFDFILGSLHNLKGDKDFYHYDYSDVDIPTLVDRYFEEVLEMVKWGRFHSLAHLTYPFRYFPEDRRPQDYRRWQEIIDEIFHILAQKGIALEINTSGLRQPIQKTLPDLPLVRRFHELGGEHITIGSDAHLPEHVGNNISDGILVAKQAGFRYITTYFKGQPEMLPIKI